jgi:hypothetical protein
VLTLAEADAELQRLTLLKKNHLDEQYVARRSVRDLPARIAGLSERLFKLSADEITAKAHADDPTTIGGRTYPREDIAQILGGKLDALPMSAPNATRISLGTYRGLRFGVVLHTHFPPDVYLEGSTTRQTMLSRDHQGPRAVLNALERLAGGYGSDCDRVRQDLAIAEAQFRDYQARLGNPFLHDAYLADLAGLRDQLKAGLSATAELQADKTKPTVSELAERIKALKSACTIEATPQRVRQQHSSAEEPIAARIRRRVERFSASEPVVAPTDPESVPDAVSAPESTAQAAEPQITFQEYVAMQRQREGMEPSRP